LALYSEQFDNASWAKQTGITITANTTETLDPSGYYGAEKVVSTDGSTGFFNFGLNLTSDITRTIYLKGAVGGETLKLKDPSGAGDDTDVTLTTSWVRYEHKTTNTGNTYQGLFVDDIPNGATIYVWGAQIEVGTFATSYIPTLGTSVTRVADVAEKTGISDLIGQTEGTLFVEVELVDTVTSTRQLQISDGTISNRIQLATSGGNFTPAIVVAGTVQALFIVPAPTGINKIAIAYANNDIAVFLNGNLVGTDTSATIPACSRLDVGNTLGSNIMTGTISQALLFKTRLSNTELAQITTL
jgi:hypothetical protein